MLIGGQSHNLKALSISVQMVIAAICAGNLKTQLSHDLPSVIVLIFKIPSHLRTIMDMVS